ncbi:MAG: hypothetical protein LQ338_004729 [Usnochroma carphineum]|nr:MAG: hypothetical protein LQ338_004729 [Usnochroma carphineum]
MNVLRRQFVDTIVVLQHYLFQRAPRFRPPIKQQQQQSDYQVVHLHVDPNLSIHDLYSISIEEPLLDRKIVPVIFPARKGTWELVVKRSALDELRKATELGCLGSTKFEEPQELPKGMVARAAQVYSRVSLVDRSVARIYVALLQNYPFHHVVKDVAESFAIGPPSSAIIDGWICQFGRFSEA